MAIMLKQRPRVFKSLLSTFITRVMSKVRPRVDSKSTLGFVRYIVFYLPRCEVFFLTRRRDVANWTNCTSHTTTGQTTAIYLDKNV